MFKIGIAALLSRIDGQDRWSWPEQRGLALAESIRIKQQATARMAARAKYRKPFIIISYETGNENEAHMSLSNNSPDNRQLRAPALFQLARQA